jgi:hypothetical protein
MRSRLLVTAALVLFASYGVLADVRTEQKTRVQLAGTLGRVVNLFGGRAAREGITSTVIVKGDRKVTTTENTSQIVDLAEEKIYDIDLRKKQYKVTTFAELRRQMEEARKKAEEEARRAEKENAGREQETQSSEPKKEVEVDVDVKNTGESKVINGFNTQQSIMTVTVREKGKTLEEGGGLVLTTDMWLMPEQKALTEVNEFDRRYAEKLYGELSGVSAQQMAMAMAMYPMMRQAIEKMQAEGTKVEGTAVQTTLTFDAVASAEQVEAQKKEETSGGGGRGLGGMLGGLARRAAKKDDEPKQRTTFMTTTVEVLKLSTDVSASDVAVPAGFKETK